MFHRNISLIVFLSFGVFLSLLLVSCSSDGLVKIEEKRIAEDVTAGEVHNEFIRAYLKRCPERKLLTREERVRAYVEIAKAICEEKSYDYKPVQAQMDEFLTTCEEWRRDGIWDIYNPATISPTDALDRFVAAGVIPAKNAPYLHRLLEELQKKSVDPRSLLTFTAAPCAEMESARDLLQSSCQLWYGQPDGAIPIEFTDDPDLVANWWKTVIKYVGVGACDGLAGWAAGCATAGNPFAIGFFGGIASIAAYEAFEERGW